MGLGDGKRKTTGKLQLNPSHTLSQCPSAFVSAIHYWQSLLFRMQRARKATLGHGCVPAGSGDGNSTPESERRTFPCWQHLISFQKIISFSIFDARAWEWGVTKAQVSFACTPHQSNSAEKQETLSFSSCPGSRPAGPMEQPRLSSISGGEELYLLLHSGWFNCLLLELMMA